VAHVLVDVQPRPGCLPSDLYVALRQTLLFRIAQHRIKIARALPPSVVSAGVAKTGQHDQRRPQRDIYEAGRRLRTAGVLSGGGMTREAALGKLHLAGTGLDNAEVRRLIELVLCSELN
jgi:hypothetical protein